MPAQVHAVANQKGGVGKTTLSMNLAAVALDVTVNRLLVPDELADEECPVLLANTDPQESADWWTEQIEKAGNELPFDIARIHNPYDLGKLKRARRGHIFVDTAGSIENEASLQATLDSADDAIVPITTDPLTFDPTKRTIQQILIPRGIPFKVVINNWDPRDGVKDLTQTVKYVQAHGWPMANVVVRRYRIHARAAADGTVVTQYQKNRVTMEAREDFYRLGMEFGFGGSIIPEQGNRQSAAASQGA